MDEAKVKKHATRTNALICDRATMDVDEAKVKTLEPILILSMSHFHALPYTTELSMFSPLFPMLIPYVTLPHLRHIPPGLGFSFTLSGVYPVCHTPMFSAIYYRDSVFFRRTATRTLSARGSPS